ncbi:MAG TPA: AEC family transporter [Azospirillaceae bacterium]|nr:AEC family transporter [Azospirillaceae bacterium]
MSIVLNVVLPVFGIILAGVVMGRTRLLGDGASDALNRFVYWAALPPVVFLGTARTPIVEFLNWPFLGTFVGGMLAVYAMAAVSAAVLHRSRPDVASLQALNACFSNTGYMGIPLFLAAFGPDRIAPAILATVMMSTLMVGLAVVVLELVGSTGKGAIRALAGVAAALARNPLVVLPVLGLALSAAEIPLPTALVTFCQLLGSAAGPCALFAIGLFLAGRPLSGQVGEVGWITVLKLVVQPVLTWVLGRHVFGLAADWLAAAVVLAALPTGSLTFVVAQQYRIYVERTSTVILVTTILSVVTLSVVLALFPP